MTGGAATPADPTSGESVGMDPDTAPSAEPLTTGDMARLTGSTLRTVRFYEQEGLIEPLERKQRGHRYFAQAQLEKLRFALDLREAGMGLAEIKQMFALREKSTNSRAASNQMGSLITERIGEVQEKIARLRRLREELSAMASSLTECESCTAETCEGCDLLESEGLPKALRVLWGAPKGAETDSAGPS